MYLSLCDISYLIVLESQAFWYMLFFRNCTYAYFLMVRLVGAMRLRPKCLYYVFGNKHNNFSMWGECMTHAKEMKKGQQSMLFSLPPPRSQQSLEILDVRSFSVIHLCDAYGL